MVSFKITLITGFGLSIVFGGSFLENGVLGWVLENSFLVAALFLLGGGLVIGGASGYSLLDITSGDILS